MSKVYKWHYLSLLMAQMAVGVNIVGCKYLVSYFSPILILIARFSIGAILLFMIHPLRPSKYRRNQLTLSDLTKRDWLFIIAQGLSAGALFNLFLLLGLHYTTASVAGIITSILPAIIAILSLLFLRERITLLTGLCIALSIIGLLILNISNFRQADFSKLLGDFLILLSLIPEGVYYLLVKMHFVRIPVFLLSALLNAINIPFILIIWLFVHHIGDLNWTSTNILVLIAVGVASALFYVFWSLGCQSVSGSTAGLFTALMPISTLFIAWLFLDEKITVYQILGMLVVISAILFNAFRMKVMTSEQSG